MRALSWSCLAVVLLARPSLAGEAFRQLLNCAPPGKPAPIEIPALFRHNEHIFITADAFKGLKGPDGGPRFSPDAENTIISADSRVDLKGLFASPPYISDQHFDNNTIEGGVDFIAWEFKQIADPRRTRNVREAQVRFGWLLHAIQDFYSHSDYAEAWLKSLNPSAGSFEQMSADPGAIPVWDRKRRAFGRELVTGSYPGPRPGMPHHDELNKDSKNPRTSPRGAVRIKGWATLFDVARAAAVKDTRALVGEFEKAVAANPVFAKTSPFTEVMPGAPEPSYP